MKINWQTRYILAIFATYGLRCMHSDCVWRDCVASFATEYFRYSIRST